MVELPSSVGTSAFCVVETLTPALVELHGLPKGHRWVSLCGYGGNDPRCFQEQGSFKSVSVSKAQGITDALRGSRSAYVYTKIGSRHRLSRKQVQHCVDFLHSASHPSDMLSHGLFYTSMWKERKKEIQTS